MLSRQQDHALRARTFAVYTPLTDMVPSDPTTMMTAMVEAQRLTHLTGQNITVFTNNQQLYRVAVNIAGVYPDLFHNLYPIRRNAYSNEFCWINWSPNGK